jgi:hypothetical protein
MAMPQNEVKSLAEAYRLLVPQFLVWAYQHRFEFDADSEGWQSPLFPFVRAVKGHPELIGLRAKAALDALERTMRVWMGKAKGDPWSHYFELDREDAQVEFLACWEKIRFVPEWEPLDQAVEQAKKMRLLPKNERTDGYQQFISIAGWLQVTMGDRNIMLPCEKLGEYLKCTPMTISRYRQWAVEDGLLTITKAHRFKAGGSGEATEFRFDTSRYDCLAKTAEKP